MIQFHHIFSVSEDDNDFYESSQFYTSALKKDIKIILGDPNAKVG